MSEHLSTSRTFEDQLRNSRSVESRNGIVRYVELTPNLPESDVPIMLLGGFGTDIDSTAQAARRLYDKGRSVVMIDRPPMKDLKDQPLEGIDGDQIQYADNVNDVAEATGHKKLDIIAQSEAAVFATAAILNEPEQYRSLVIESGAGLIDRPHALKLVADTALDTVLGAHRYLRNPVEAARFNRSMVGQMIHGGPAATAREITSIAKSQIKQALTTVRSEGIKVAYIHANSDGAFKPQEVEKNIVLDMDGDGEHDNVDAYSSVADKNARHGSLLFDGMGIDAALAHIRQFEAEAGDRAA